MQEAWLVFECVPEMLQLKIDTFAELEEAAPDDCILATNSSSYKSSEMLVKVSDAAKKRILNTHYFMPPKIMATELMTDGFTSPELFPFLVERFKEAGLRPYVARRESTGFIFNKLWAAVKRELLTILAEDVAKVPTLDAIYSDAILGGSYPPFRLMDRKCRTIYSEPSLSSTDSHHHRTVTGLDTIAFIEEHYIKERNLPRTHLDYLRQNYIAKGKLGNKSPSGGFYLPPTPSPNPSTAQPPRRLLALDLDLSSPTSFRNAGALLSLALPVSPSPTPTINTLLSNLPAPDGIAICPRPSRVFWTTMAAAMGAPDGALHTATLPHLSDAHALIGADDERVHTPKQVCVDSASRQVYFCDREGMGVLRCGYEGEGLEEVVRNGDWRVGGGDARRWCVGVAVARGLGKVFWSQKGPSKGGEGRISCKRLDGGGGEAEEVLGGLPEPIDLEWVEREGEEGGRLYWTDRGELPFGNSLNMVRLDGSGRILEDEKVAGSRKYRILATKFNEAIGLKVDAGSGRIFVTDLAGAFYSCDLDGHGKRKIYEDDSRAFSGLAIQ